MNLREPAAPPPPAAAAAQPAAPGTIFCRRPGLGGGYQPPLRRRQPTQPPTPGRPAPGAAPSFGGCGVGRSRCSGPSLRAGTESACRGAGTGGSRSSKGPGRGRRGVCYCQLGPSAAEHAGKQPAGGGALRAAQPGGCANAEVAELLGRARLGSRAPCPAGGSAVLP